MVDSVRRLGHRKWGAQVRVLATIAEIESMGWNGQEDN